MNRTAMVIALVIATVVGIIFAVSPRLDLDISAPFYDRNREVFAAAGIAGGLVYWLIAGRRAGAWK